ncbi:MAG: DUF72 domain-containing protein [Caldilineales bacterium]|nr:DUF72 domain-containing protein [Caldilineales bacterium]MDW8318695.1 DUF72 domain-containing protein [Anaerolineae bacterium]
MPSWYLGTMGFAYEPWRGVFYPPGVASRAYLAHYSRVFNAVELDSTFYGAPRPATLHQWAAQTPPDFRFCPKTPREITHEHSLAPDRGAVDAMLAFLDTTRVLGRRLGPVLIQLPPSFGPEQREALAGFLAALPADLRYAVELRHRGWYTPTTADLLRSFGVAWVALDYLDLPRQVHVTADFLYIRWVGQHGRWEQRGREEIDVTPQLRWWWEQLQPALGQTGEVYGFFNDDYAGYAPATCNRLKAMAGLPVVEPEIPQQGTLFGEI